MPGQISPSNFRNVLLCEDIRKEVGNKRTVVGIFPADIVVASVPAVLALATYIEFVAPSVGDLEMEFRFVVGSDEIAILKATLNDLHVGELAVLELPKIGLNVTAPTEVSLSARVAGGESERLVTKKILVGEQI